MTIILHGAVFEDRLHLWGEESKDAGATGVGSRRRSKTPGVRLHPYDAGPDGVVHALEDVSLCPSLRKPSAKKVLSWLPSQGGLPVPSSLLIAEPAASKGKRRVEPWLVHAFALSPKETIELLCACADKRVLAPGLVMGPDLFFWPQALRLAGALVARQQYIPGVRTKHDEYHACWKPVFSNDDRHRLRTLSRAMPPAAKALTADNATAAPEIPALKVVGEFVGEMLDGLVRFSAAGLPDGDSGRSSCRTGTAAFDSVHDQWLYALRADDRRLEGSPPELAEFSEQVQKWQHPVAMSGAAPFRLCLRLEEPHGVEASGEVVSDSWYVRFLLQAWDDPSLLVPAEEAWKPRGRNAAVFKRYDFNVHEYLLTSLGQAASLCPRIEAGLRSAKPAGYHLDSTGAYEFMTEKAVLLGQGGFGVMLPAWWTRKGAGLRLAVRGKTRGSKMRAESGISLDQMVQVDWEVVLGDQALSLEELEALARLKSPLVRLRGQWVQMSAAEIEAAIDLWKRKTSEKSTLRDLVRMSLGPGKAAEGVAFQGIKADGWIAEFLGQLEGRADFEELAPPPGFTGTLRPYQLRGYSWLGFLRRWGLGACLADDMGLGKTIQTLALVERDRQAGSKRPVLLVCPTSVINNWRKEAERFTPGLPVIIHHGITRARGEMFVETAAKQAIVISSYALLFRDIEYLQQVDWAGIVLDEAQNIRNSETGQARAARSLAAGYRIALTGTPVENNVGDLWSIMEFLNPGFLGSRAAFQRNFFIPIQAGRDEQAANRLKRITGPFILRRLKTDKTVISDLPEKLEMKVFCNLTKEQASLYAAVLKETEEGLEVSEGIQRRGLILATLSKLKQVCNHPAQFLKDNSRIAGRSGKLARLCEMLEEMLEVGDRALVFTQFAEMGELLKRHLQDTLGREVPFLHGGLTKKQRDRMVERFQADGTALPVFILSLKAGGTGLNLTGGNHVFHFDRWWNPAVEDQATDRAFRIGQARNVQVHKFICAGTLEEKLDEMIEHKKEIAGKVVGTGEKWLTELSNEDLKSLFALRAEAVEE